MRSLNDPSHGPLAISMPAILTVRNEPQNLEARTSSQSDTTRFGSRSRALIRLSATGVTRM